MYANEQNELALRIALRDITADFSGKKEETGFLQKSELFKTSSKNILPFASSQIITLSMVQVLELAYFAIKEQLNVLGNARLSFDKERQAHIATFLLPASKERQDLSKEEQVMAAFIALIEQSPLFNLFGIQPAILDEKKKHRFYSVLPCYRMSEGLSPVLVQKSPLDSQRLAVRLFLKTALPDAIADIDLDFTNDSKFIEFFKSAFEKDNYLNQLRVPRFIIMSIANLLWNLEHPFDQKTGLPLSLEQCVRLCREAEGVISKLLNKEASPNLNLLSEHKRELMHFLVKAEMHIKALRTAYVQEQLYAFNLNDVTNCLHQGIRIVNQSLIKSVYCRTNGEEELATNVSYIQLLLQKNPDLLQAFNDSAGLVPEKALMNAPLLTTLDAMILFCHLTSSEQNKLLKKIVQKSTVSAVELAETLREIRDKFLAPLQKISEDELQVSIFNPKYKEASSLTARRFLPLMTLVLQNYGIETGIIGEQGEIKPNLLHGMQQVREICENAAEEKGYYCWQLSALLGTKKEKTNTSKNLKENLNALPKNQYRMLQIAMLLRQIDDLLEHYRNVLQYQAFQTFLLNCISQVAREIQQFSDYIKETDRDLSSDESLSRSLQDNFRDMIIDLQNNFKNLENAVENFAEIVQKPFFIEKYRQTLKIEMCALDTRYRVLFGKESGIRELFDGALPLEPDENNLKHHVTEHHKQPLQKDSFFAVKTVNFGLSEVGSEMVNKI